MKNNGFTLIELLAVIIILGILMIIAIPSVTKYISDSRKNAYVDTAKEIISGARNLVNGGKLEMFDTDTTYYINQECIQTENASKSPYGEFTKAYVVVTYNGKGYDYYWTSVDDAGQGISKITKLDNLDVDKIESDLTDNDIPDSLGIDGRSKYMIIDKQQTNCGKGVSTTVTDIVSGETGTNPVIYPEGKDKTTVVTGDIVKIGTEEFYVIKHQGNDLVLLAKYNLKVGNRYTFDRSNGYIKVGEYTYSDEGYGMQSPETIQYEENNIKYYNGVVQFSSTNYWNNGVSEYPADIYNSNSNIKQYVDNYAKKIGIKVVEARLLYYSEAEELGCRLNNHSCGMGYSFLSETTYWTGTAKTRDYIIFIANNYNFDYTNYNSENSFGVRPVIVI